MDTKLTEVKLSKVQTKTYLVFEFKAGTMKDVVSVSLDYLKSFASTTIGERKKVYLQFSEKIEALTFEQFNVLDDELLCVSDTEYFISYKYQLFEDLIQGVW